VSWVAGELEHAGVAVAQDAQQADLDDRQIVLAPGVGQHPLDQE
jgi:hypothetical protein